MVVLSVPERQTKAKRPDPKAERIGWRGSKGNKR
jgi:hypothetical protein